MSLCISILLVLFLNLLLLLEPSNVLTSVLIQIKLEMTLLMEIFIRVWQELAVLLYLLDLLEVLSKHF